MKFTRYLLLITVTSILLTGCFAHTSPIDNSNAVADLTAIEIGEKD